MAEEARLCKVSNNETLIVMHLVMKSETGLASTNSNCVVLPF